MGTNLDYDDHRPARTLEVCVDNVDGLSAAIAGGADRIELCDALELGGLTPTAGLLHIGAASPLPVVARIRPRGGDFCFDGVEIQLMLNEIDAVAAIGLQGVVLGASLRNGELDRQTLERLVRRARSHGLECALHRAIDLCPDQARATRLAIELGFARILTSGGAGRAARAGLLAALLRRPLTFIPANHSLRCAPSHRQGDN